MTYQPIERWLPTPAAAEALGCSAIHLKRQRDIQGGFLQAGVHYSLGVSRTAPITWNVEACRKAIHHRGLMARNPKQPAPAPTR
jgi:hypothetical protein